MTPLYSVMYDCDHAIFYNPYISSIRDLQFLVERDKMNNSRVENLSRICVSSDNSSLLTRRVGSAPSVLGIVKFIGKGTKYGKSYC